MKHPSHYDTNIETSIRMSHVHLKRGKEEVLLSKALWHKRYRYYLNYKKLPGSPDIAIKKYNIAVFVDGEFWHGYDWDNKKQKLVRNKEYWIQKIEENINRDRKKDSLLIDKGWTPIHFWTKEIRKDLQECVRRIERLIKEESR